MQIPLVDVLVQCAEVQEELDRAVLEVLHSGRFISGAKVAGLERWVADYVGAADAIGVSSGTDALLVALMALGVSPGDLVLTVPFSFFATAGVVARLGAAPVFVDIEADTFGMDPVRLREWFESHPAERDRVKAIIVVHLYGQCARMDEIRAVAADYSVPVIEDAAQALGSTYPSEFRPASPSGVSAPAVTHAGAIAEIGCFSFFPTKNLGGIGDGGMVVTTNPAIGEHMRLLRNHGAKERYYHDFVGGNFRLDEIQAAALLVKAPLLEGWHSARRENARFYREAFGDLPVQAPAEVYGGSHHIFNQCVYWIGERRDALRSWLAERGVSSEVYYPVPFHLQKCFAYLGYTMGEFPVSERAARETLALPVYPGLTAEMRDYVVQQIRGFFRQ